MKRAFAAGPNVLSIRRPDTKTVPPKLAIRLVPRRVTCSRVDATGGAVEQADASTWLTHRVVLPKLRRVGQRLH